MAGKKRDNSQRDEQILDLDHRGFSNVDIAHLVNVSPRTVARVIASRNAIAS